MQPVQAIQTVHLFPGLNANLLAVLKPLTQPDWQRPTACPGWSIKDVSAHLLGGSLGRLAGRREQFAAATGQTAAALNDAYALWDGLPAPCGPFVGFDDLLDWINQHNAAWIQVARQISTADLLLALEAADPLLYAHFSALPADGPAGPAVLWAGETHSLNWFDIAREYTEKWLHQQHIREALGQPLLSGREWLYPVLDTFLRALPYTYRARIAPPGTALGVSLSGAAGGEWTLLRQDDAWVLYCGAASRPDARVSLPAELAWRLFTKGIGSENARPLVKIEGDPALGEEILRMVSIMA